MESHLLSLLTAGDNDLYVCVVNNVLDRIRTKGIVQRNRNQVVAVAAHLRNEPLGATVRPDTERPSVQLLVAQDHLVQVHDTTAKRIHTLIDLCKCLPRVAAVGLGNRVVRTMAQKVLVGVLGDRWTLSWERLQHEER